MTLFQSFGATTDDVVARFASVSVDALGGTSTIADQLAIATRAVLGALPSAVIHRLQAPDHQVLTRDTGDGQTQVSLGLAPVVIDSPRLWAVVPGTRSAPPSTDEPSLPIVGLDPATGVVTVDPLPSGRWLVASYRVATDDPAFAVPSLGDLATLLAAVALGDQAFVSDDGPWHVITRWHATAQTWLGDLARGDWLPPELTRLDWWRPFDGRSAIVHSPRRHRA